MTTMESTPDMTRAAQQRPDGSDEYVPAPRRRSGVIISVVLLLAGVVVPLVTDSNYWLSVLSLALTFMVIAQALNMASGYAGFFALGITVPWVAGGYATAILTKTYDWETVPAILVSAVGVGIAMALIAWATVTRGRDAFAILSLVLMLFLQLVLQLWTEVTGGGLGLTDLPVLELGFVRIVTPEQFYWVTLIVVAVIMALMYLMLSSRWGRTLRATNTDEVLASSLGVSLVRNRIMVLAIGGFFCAIVGGLHVLRLSVAVPSMAGFVYLAPLLAIIFIGGPGNFFGVMIAAVVVTVLPELARGFDDWRQFFYGALLVVLCLVFPAGVPARVAEWSHLARKRRLRSSMTGSSTTETDAEATA